ncbi:leucine-rich repeat protein SHOC-2-like [Zootermopsis nevadensis]|nr:leucine-rich repeat protein SHOC-2-like [Zootermopsis nevadensis]XP_021913218.1 leucine-rich repeat protein SHOC-2-like [Zootermopsis nevadensis]XP_021913219.1 leucine-rich repeat protein SHOC-2-like [Zootermopsis nevadensis]XP_021913220.1 leucine-rich repeat protein SHOC-2-like [Zootermopsis nevadensis]
MDEVDVLSSNPKYAESAHLEPRNGISALPCSVNSTLKFESQNLEQVHESVFNNEELKNIRELILTHTDIQNLPSSFTANLGNLIRLNLEENRLDQLPLNMRNLLKLQHLNISHNCFKVLSEEIGYLVTLQTLRLESNSLVELPDSVCSLVNLRQLCIANNNLRILPSEISKLVKLEKLDVSGNILEDLPESMSQLTNLCHFSAASNKLSYLSESFTHLNKLTTLNLSYNSMYEVPYCLFTGLPNVSVLYLSHNYIDSFSEVPNCSNKLRRLRLDHNCLYTIPRWIFRDTCKHLLEFNISHNKYMIGVSNEVFISESSLKSLDLSDCSLTTTCVKFLHGLKSLEYLNMGNSKCVNNELNGNSGNIFWDIPISELRNSCNLQGLILCGVGLGALPEDIIQLSQLQHLDLCSNDLNWLPDSFCSLIRLKSCLLSNNALELLPMQLGNLEALKELRLDGNKLYSLPESMTRLEQLEILDLYGNTLEEVPGILNNMPSLKGLDLEYNCFDVLKSLKGDNFLDKYIYMKCNIRSRLTSIYPPRMDCERPPLDCDMCLSGDDKSSNTFDEEVEIENIPDENDSHSYVCKEEEEEEEENWDATDEVNDNFDPTFLPLSPRKKVQHHRALLVMDSLISSSDNFCPADIHVPPVKTFPRPKCASNLSFQAVEGQFDDVSSG